ncbi:hypothetical protein INT48_008829 [Thamnidium elegans]|uniref:Uncharacterized protein n=1 Tax=Thamnidium elegans TaxID=101142 RepID=A0A8H7SLH6_9FUNG|nr:hypothetical protein INT48_008829 [Thamnidium elegans]
MGLLNFRKKNKKSDILKDSLPKLTCKNNSSASTNSEMFPESYSPVVNSFMPVSSISDVTSSSLLDEILNELPSPKKRLNSSSGSETSPTRNIRYSLNLNSNRSNNNPAKNFDRKEKASVASTQIMLFPRIVPCINSHRMSNDPYNATRIKADTVSMDFSNSSDESESDSLSIDSLLISEEPSPSHPISWSDSRFSPGFIAKKREDTIPLMELISRSYDAGNTLPTGVKSREAIKGGAVISSNEIDPPIISRSSGFAIDRMKERHRQEYRRSISYTPSEAESSLISTQRNNLLAINNSHNSISPSQEYQRIHATSITNNQTNSVEFRSNRMAPKKSFSTNTSNFPENIANNPVNLKPVATYAANQQDKQRHPQYNGSINKHYNSSKNLNQNGNTFNFKSNQAAIFSYNTRQSYHVSTVPSTFDPSGPLQRFFGSTTNNRKSSKHMENEFRQDSSSSIQVIQKEKFTGFNDSLQINMETTPILRKEYRRMQHTHKHKYYSIPNLQHLQDNGKLEKDLRRNPLETNIAETKIINSKKTFNQKMKSEKIYSKNIYDVSENQQHYNNKFIYRYSHTPQHPHNHKKKCHHHQRRPEPSCSSPFEPSSTKNHQSSQYQIKLDNSRNSRHF